MKIWWLSYATPTEQKGVCVVRAPSFLEACSEARRLGISPDISPGGEVMGFDAPPEEEASLEPLVGRFLSVAEAREHGGVSIP